MNSELRQLWKIPKFRHLLMARVISNIGNGMSPIALAFGVLSLKGANAGSLSFVTTAQMIPLVLFLLVGGVAADRFGRSQLVGITDIIGAAVVSVSALAFLTGHASIPLLCVNGFIFGALNALWYPAFSGLMPQIVPVEILQPANSVLGVGANIGFTVGASVAGIIVSTGGPGWALLGDAASFLAAGILVLRLRLPRVDQGDSANGRIGVIAQLRDGWYEFRSRQWIVSIVSCFAFFHMAFEGFLGVLAPVQSKENLHGASDMGLMMLAFGIGGILGMGFAIRARPKRPLLLAVGVLPIPAMWMFALAGPAPIYVLMIFAAATGVAIDLSYAIWITTIHTNVPDAALSRIGSYDAFGSLVFAPIGLFLAGPLTHLIGVRNALLIAGGVAVFAAGAPLLSRDVRTLRNTSALASAEA